VYYIIAEYNIHEMREIGENFHEFATGHIYDAKLSSRPFLAFKNGQFSKLPHPLPHPLHPVANRFQKPPFWKSWLRAWQLKGGIHHALLKK